MILKYNVNEEIIVKEYLLKQGISRKLGRKIKLYGKILINGSIAYNYSKLSPGDKLEIIYQEEINDQIPLSSKPIDIVYEDQYLIIINKPPNLSVQPSRKHIEDNLIARIKNYYNQKNINNNVHLVNRLDYSTSGLLIVAIDGFMHQQLADKTCITKKYIALVEGHIEDKEGIITLPIEKVGGHSIKRKVSEEGQTSITYYKVLKEESGFSFLELTLETGRCHQIRLHLSTLNHPIVGDKLYGNGNDDLFLHSYYLKFMHPITKKEIEIIKYPSWYK